MTPLIYNYTGVALRLVSQVAHVLWVPLTHARRHSQGEEGVVDIVAMVHLADPLYYKELQEATQDHDRVLYELIVDKDVVSEDSAGVRRLSEPMVCTRNPTYTCATLSHSHNNPDYLHNSLTTIHSQTLIRTHIHADAFL